MLRASLIIFICTAVGAAMGHFGSCTGGQCPLTSTWWRGALYGAALATLFILTSRRA